MKKASVFLKNLFENVEDIIYRINIPSGEFEYINKAIESISGYTQQEFYKNPSLIQKIIHPEWKSHFNKKWNDLLNGNLEPYYEYPIVSKSGDMKWIYQRNVGVYDGEGQLIALEAIATDISRYKKEDKALPDSEDRYRKLVEFSPIGIALYRDDSVIYINKSGAAILGFDSTDEVTGKSVFKFIHNDDIEVAKARIENAYEKNSNPLITEKFIRKDGSSVYVEIMAIHITYQSQPATLVFFQDASMRKKSQEKSRYLLNKIEEKNAELENIIYVASHDIRSPLVNIQGFSRELAVSLNDIEEILKEDDINVIRDKILSIIKDDLTESIEFVSSSVIKIDKLLGGLLKLSRISRHTPTIKEIDMTELVQTATKLSGFDSRGITIKIDELPKCYSDEVMLNQIITVLLDNASKYLSSERDGVIEIKGYEEEDFSIYCIKDNGIGIEEKHYSKIFDIFYRLNPRKTEGDGLGLSIARKILMILNGKIWVKSEPDKGSVFYISLPNKYKNMEEIY